MYIKCGPVNRMLNGICKALAGPLEYVFWLGFFQEKSCLHTPTLFYHVNQSRLAGKDAQVHFSHSTNLCKNTYGAVPCVHVL